MKKLFITCVACLFAINLYAQTTPSMAPSSYKSKVINSVLLYKAVGLDDIHASFRIPVYLNTPANTTIRYCWYSTESVYGEIVRTGTNPAFTEEGTYTNGRLSTYKTGYGVIFNIEWSTDGEIESIKEYDDSNGRLIKSYTLSSFGLRWVDGELIRQHGKGLTNDGWLYVTNVLVIQIYNESSKIGFVGYGLSDNGYLIEKEEGKYIGKKAGQLAKDWVDYKRTKILITIMPDGRLKVSNMYDINNSVGYECYEL